MEREGGRVGGWGGIEGKVCACNSARILFGFWVLGDQLKFSGESWKVCLVLIVGWEYLGGEEKDGRWEERL
jgi:hypothetical protein